MESLWLVARCGYDPVKDDELKYKVGDRIQQLKPPRGDGWFWGLFGGKRGWVDSSNVVEPDISCAATSGTTSFTQATAIQSALQTADQRRDSPCKRPDPPETSSGASPRESETGSNSTKQAGATRQDEGDSELSDRGGATKRAAGALPRAAAAEDYVLTAADVSAVLNKACDLPKLRSILSSIRSKDKTLAADIEGEIDIKANLTKPELLARMVELRVKDREGVAGLVEWLFAKKLVTKSELMTAAGELGLKKAKKALQNLLATNKRARKSDGATCPSEEKGEGEAVFPIEVARDEPPSQVGGQQPIFEAGSQVAKAPPAAMALRQAEGKKRPSPAPEDPSPSLLTAENLVFVMDKGYTSKFVHEILQKVKDKQSALEGAVGVTTRNSKEQILLGLVELRAKGRDGLVGLLRWLEEAKTGVKISELANTASSLGLKDLSKALRGVKGENKRAKPASAGMEPQRSVDVARADDMRVDSESVGRALNSTETKQTAKPVSSVALPREEKALRQAEGKKRPSPAPEDPSPSLLTAENLVFVMDKGYTLKFVHEILQKVKDKQSALEGAVGVTTRNSKEQILLGLVELRAKGRDGLVGLLRWLEEAKTGVKISDLAQTASGMDLKDLAKALRGVKGESNKRQLLKTPAKPSPGKEQSDRDGPALAKTKQSVKPPIIIGANNAKQTPAELSRTMESRQSEPSMGESNIVMLCFSTGELDESVLSTLRAIGQPVQARVLLSSDMGFPLFNPKGRSLALEGKSSALHTDYLKFGLGYIHELYGKLSKEFDSDELIPGLLFEQLDRKWRIWKHGMGRFKLDNTLKGSYFVQDARELPLPTFNLEFASLQGTQTNGPNLSVSSSQFDEATCTWQMQGNLQNVELELEDSEMAKRFLPGVADTRVSVMRLFTSTDGQPSRDNVKLADGFVFIFRRRSDVDRLLERYATIQEETLKAEINERRVTLQLFLPAENLSSFTFVSDEISFLYFLDNWRVEVLKALGDSERAKPHAWTRDASRFDFLECTGVDDSEHESPWNISSSSSKREELVSLVRFGLDDQVGTLSFRLHLKDEMLSEAKSERVSGWLEPQNVFLEQQNVAQRILERISFVLGEQGERLGTSTPARLEDFTDLKFVVLLPNYTTLRDQTLIRVQDLLPSASQSQVFFYSLNNTTSFRRFSEDAISHPKSLFLLIADECHWGVVKGAAHDAFVNEPALCNLHNVFMLLVSATPYNALTSRSRIPCRPITKFEGNKPVAVSDTDLAHSYSMAEEQEELHVIEWFPKSSSGSGGHRTHVESRRYLRLEYYLSTIHSKVRHEAVGLDNRPLGAQKIRSDPWFESLKKQFSGDPSKIRFDVVLLADYIFSLVYFACVRWDHDSGTLRDDTSRCDVDMVVKAKKALALFAKLTQGPCEDQPDKELKQAADKYLVHLHDLIADTDDESGENEDPITAEDLATVFKNKLSEEEEMGKPKPLAREVETEAVFLTETDIIIRDLLRTQNGKGRMKVVRTYSEKYACLWEAKLKQCQQEFGGQSAAASAEDPFAVIMDTGSLSLYQRLHPWILRRSVPFCTCPRESRPQRGEPCTKGHAIKDLSSGLQYIHLVDLPCILILVDKGRMGDTFPQSMDCLDLRIRVSLNRTTLVQELGRLCRYPSFDAAGVALDSWDEANDKVGPLFADGKCVAVFLEDGKTFVGYASHLLNFEPLAEIKLCTKTGKARIGPSQIAAQESSDANLEFLEGHAHAEGLEYALGVEGESFEKPCVVRVSEGKEEKGSRERKALRTFRLTPVKRVQSHQSGPAEKTARARDKVNSVFLGIDVASLEHLFRRCNGRCVVRSLSYPFPCALIRADVMQKLETAVEVADNRVLNPDIRKTEISLCVQLGSLDKFMVQKGKIKNFEYHQYRKHWNPSSQASNHHFDAPERSNDRHDRRFLLFAECQIGKTGAYVSLLHQLRSRMTCVETSDQEGGAAEDATVVEPVRMHTPKAIFWECPYWLGLAHAKPSPYFRVGPSKYREKFAVFRFRALLDCCTEAKSDGHGPEAETSWVARYEQRLEKDECILSSASRALLKQALDDLRLAPPPSKWIDDRKSEFENFLDESAKRTIVEDAVNWDRRLNWETDNPLIGTVLDVRAVPGKERAALLHTSLPSCWADVYNRPRSEGEDGGTATVNLRPSEQLVTITVPVNSEVVLPSSFKNRQGNCPRRDMFLDPAMQRGALGLGGLTKDRIRLSVPEHFISKGYIQVKPGTQNVVATLSEKAGRFRWIFHPTSGRESKALLDYSACIKEEFAQVFVVKDENSEMERYLAVWGGYENAIVLGLPRSMKTGALFTGPEQTFLAHTSGVGFCRLFIQVVGYLLGLHFLWMLDDNISETREMDLAQVDTGSHSRENPPKQCSIREPLAHLEWLVDRPQHDRDGAPVSGELEDLGRDGGGGWSWRAHPGGPGLWAECTSVSSQRSTRVSPDSLPDFMGHPSGIGLVGMHRCWTTWMTLSNPFNKTHSVYSFVLLNAKDTCERRVFYPPKPAWEDIDFCFDLMEKGFQVVKVNRWFHSKLNFQTKYQKPERRHGSAQTWHEGCQLTIRKAEANQNPSKQCWFRMRSYVENFIAEWKASCVVIGSSNQPSWKALTTKSGLPKQLLFENLQKVPASTETLGVVFAFPPWDEDEEARDMRDLLETALKRAMRSKEEKGGSWQQILLVLSLDAACATPDGKPLTWGDCETLVTSCGARIVEIATTAGDGTAAIEVASACRMSEPRSKQCADSYFLLKVAFADASLAGGDRSKGAHSKEVGATRAAGGVGTQASEVGCEQEIQHLSEPASGSAKAALHSAGGEHASRRKASNNSDPRPIEITASQEVDVKEASGKATRARIPSGCRITFKDPGAAIKDIRVETVAPDRKMKSAAARSNNAVSGTSGKSEVILGGAVHKFLPSGTRFDPPVALRLPLDTELQRQMRAQGLDAKLGIFMWCEQDSCWKEVSNPTRISDSEVEVLSSSFSFYVPGLYSLVHKVKSFFSHNPPASHLSCFGRPDPEQHIRKDISFDFKIQFCPVQHVAADPSPSEEGVVPTQDQGNLNLIRCQLPTQLSISLHGQNFDEQPIVAGLPGTGDGNGYNWTEITENGHGSVHFVLKYTPQNDGDPVRLYANIYEMKDGQIGPKLKHVYMKFRPDQLIAPAQHDRDNAPPRIAAFFSRCRSDMHLDTEGEAQELRRCLLGAYDFHPHSRPSFDDFRKEMRNASLWKTRVVHFAGHGDREGLHWVDETGTDTRIRDAQATAQLVGRQSISSGGSVECVVLNACKSKDLGECIRREGIPRVICWDGKVLEEDAKAFASVFYEHLCHLHMHPSGREFGDDLKEAFEFGKRNVEQARRERRSRPASGGQARAPTKPAEVEPTEANLLMISADGVVSSESSLSTSAALNRQPQAGRAPAVTGAPPSSQAQGGAPTTSGLELQSAVAPPLATPVRFPTNDSSKPPSTPTRSVSDEAANSPRDSQEIPPDDMLRILDKAFTSDKLRTLFGRLKKQPEAGELETKVKVLLATAKKQELLEVLAGLRVKGRAGLVGFVEWMIISKPAMVTKKALENAARECQLNRLVKAIRGLARKARVDAESGQDGAAVGGDAPASAEGGSRGSGV